MWLFLSLACKCSSDLRATLKPEQQHKQSVVHWDAFLHCMDVRMLPFFLQLLDHDPVMDDVLVKLLVVDEPLLAGVDDTINTCSTFNG